MISVNFQGKPFNITVIQVYASTTNADEAEVEQFYDDLQNLLELTPKKDILFIIGDWNAKVGSQEIPGVKGKFDFGAQNEAGQRLTEFCQEQQGETGKPPSVINAKKQRKRIEWGRLEISSRKLEIPREHFMQR